MHRIICKYEFVLWKEMLEYKYLRPEDRLQYAKTKL